MRSWAGVYFHFTFLLSTAGKHGVPIIDCPVCLDIFSSLFSTDTTVIYYYYYYYDFSHVSRVPATSDESGFSSIVPRSAIVWRVRFVFFFSTSPHISGGRSRRVVPLFAVLFSVPPAAAAASRLKRYFSHMKEKVIHTIALTNQIFTGVSSPSSTGFHAVFFRRLLRRLKSSRGNF